MENVFRTCHLDARGNQDTVDQHPAGPCDPIASRHDGRDEAEGFVNHAVEVRKRGEGVRVVHVDAVNLGLHPLGVVGEFGEEPPETDEHGTSSVTGVEVST